ncbi:MAG: hypothetical protein U9P38_08670 [Campylobacterota bacterium]|nr:hypothetical protein [Campylobacterota bacterium]
MSLNAITIKPNNHRIYPCPNDKKIELLNKIISENENSDILVVCSTNVDAIKEAIENKDIKIIEDRELVKSTDISCEILISYDIPIKSIVYMARVSKATQSAIILVDASEQKNLYPIEMLLGRSIKQEAISGFEYEAIKASEVNSNKMTQGKIKEVAKKRYDAKLGEPKEISKKPKRNYDNDRKSYDKEGKKQNFKKSDSSDKWAKKKKEPNKFLGYDESGKAKFSGKSGERNHRFDGTPKDKYDAPTKVGRKISIKSRKFEA